MDVLMGALAFFVMACGIALLMYVINR